MEFQKYLERLEHTIKRESPFAFFLSYTAIGLANISNLKES